MSHDMTQKQPANVIHRTLKHSQLMSHDMTQKQKLEVSHDMTQKQKHPSVT